MNSESPTQPLPCPFCGHARTIPVINCIPNTGGNTQYVYCSLCSAQGPWGKGRDKAVALWNTRATEPVSASPATAEPEALGTATPISDAELLRTADARVWAREFRRIALDLGYSDMDEGWLIGWFANAMMVMYDLHGKQQELAATQRELASVSADRDALRVECERLKQERGELYDSVNSKLDALEQAGHQLADLRADNERLTKERDYWKRHYEEKEKPALVIAKEMESARAQLAAMTAERDGIKQDYDLLKDDSARLSSEVRARFDAQKQEKAISDGLRADRDRLAEQVKALLPFASHKNDCWGLYSEMGSGDTTCTCGYEAAARGAKP